HLGSREYLFRHYDSEVQGRTWLRPGEGDATVLRVRPDRPLGLAFAVGGNPFWCANDPELGARHAVSEAARNVACAGARPWALTDCLNFGRPEDPQVLRERTGSPPALDLAREARLEELAVLAAEGRWVRAAHDVADGGLAVALAEMALAAPADLGLGVDADLGVLETAATLALFSERPGIVFEVSPERAARLFQTARDRSLLAWPVGTVAGHGRLRARLPGGGTLEWTVAELRAAADAALARLWNEELE